jgi:hypothetical protein
VSLTDLSVHAQPIGLGYIVMHCDADYSWTLIGCVAASNMIHRIHMEKLTHRFWGLVCPGCRTARTSGSCRGFSRCLTPRTSTGTCLPHGCV